MHKDYVKLKKKKLIIIEVVILQLVEFISISNNINIIN